MTYIVAIIVFAALIIWAYSSPEAKAYKKWYAKKFGYWDTALCVVLLVGYNFAAYAAFGAFGLFFPFSLIYDVLLIIGIISSVINVKKYKDK